MLKSIVQTGLFVRVLLSALLCFAALPSFAAEAKHPAETLIQSSETAIRVDPELSRRNAEAALEMLKRQPDADLEIQAYLLLCDYYSERDRDMAQQQIDKAKTLLPSAKRQGLRASVANYEGEINETIGDNARALELYQQAVKFANTAHDDEMLAKALYSRGYILGLQGKYAAGFIDLQRAKELFEHLNMPSYALNVMNSIALLYNRLGDYQQAVHIYEQALKLQRANGMRREEAVSLHNRARALENLGHWDAAAESYTSSYDISQELRYTRGVAYALRGLGAVANAKGDPQAALTTLDRAAALQKETADARLQAQIQLARGIALHKLQRSAESVEALEQAQRIFKQAESLNELSSAYAELAAVYADLGNWRKAYEARSSAQSISDTALRNQLDQRFATLKIEFDTANKDKENELLTRENQANQKALAQGERARKLQMAVITLAVVLLILLGIMAWHQRRDKQRMRALAMTDELTAVPNRRAVLTRLDAILLRRDAVACAMLIIDIDHFKSINDQFGHPAGDETLKLVAQQLRNAAREPAFVGRLGGEEFVLVLPNTSLEAAMTAAECFREAVAELDLTHWLINRRITVSIGVTVSIPGTDTPSSMLRRADAALYAAKNGGRNCVRSAAPRSQMSYVVDVEESALSIAETKVG